MIYQGAPSRMLPVLAAVAHEKLSRNIRCIYLNSPPMVAGMRSYISAAGVDVARAIDEGRLLLSSEQGHLVEGDFDPEGMTRRLEQMLDEALEEGFDGVWATGDMSWEFGPRRDFSKLMEYEWRLEDLFRRRPEMSGICQYHADTLPDSVLRTGLVCHPTLFVNATLSRINPQFLEPERRAERTDWSPEMQAALARAMC